MILYIAVSLDGFIAGKAGELDWLFTEGDYGYEEFFTGIDATLMGHETYKVIRAFGEPFPYVGKQNWVLSRQDRPEYPHVTFVQGEISEIVRRLKQEVLGDIWLVGGGQVARACLEAGLIDTFRLFVHPIILGEGIPLFLPQPHRQNLEVLETRTYADGMVELHYRKASKHEISGSSASD
ncbi:MAG: dihydrofolate reductase family protein [Bacteroidota bacterium]